MSGYLAIDFLDEQLACPAFSRSEIAAGFAMLAWKILLRRLVEAGSLLGAATWSMPRPYTTDVFLRKTMTTMGKVQGLRDK